jgi:hypothetical protein
MQLSSKCADCTLKWNCVLLLIQMQLNDFYLDKKVCNSVIKDPDIRSIWKMLDELIFKLNFFYFWATLLQQMLAATLEWLQSKYHMPCSNASLWYGSSSVHVYYICTIENCTQTKIFVNLRSTGSYRSYNK